MSLHTAAKHLAAQGRTTDTTLVHMSPREVGGLQALAQQHGGSLSINPSTGLPEANFLEKILPAVAGFALGPAGFGLMSSLGAAATVGGIVGLSSNSLSKGILAGVNAYGGAGLGEGLMGLGGASEAATAATAADAGASGPLSGAAFSNSTAPTDVLGTLQKGAGAAMEAPKDFLKDQSGNLFKAFGPAVLGSLASTEETGAPPTQTSPGYIRKYAKDPVTGALYQVSATPTSEFGSQSAVTFGGVPQRTGYADGGTVGMGLSHVRWNADTQKYDTVSSDGKVIPANTGPVTFGGVGKSTRVNDPTDNRTDSQKASDYLMGVPGAKNPMLFTHVQPEKMATAPLDMYTRKGGHYVYNEETGAYDWLADAGTGAGDAGLGALYKANNAGGFDAGSTTDSSNTAGPGLATMGMNGIASLGQALGLVGPTVGPSEGLAPVSNAGTSIGMPTPNDTVAADDQTDASVQGQTQAEAQAQGANSVTNDTGVGTASNPGLGVDGISTGNDAATAAANDAAATSASANDAGMDGGPGGPGGPGVGGNDADARGGFYSGGRFDNRAAAHYAYGGIANLSNGGLGSLGGYSDGGQLLKGPGDGVSDGIPATIGRGQPARLANNEFVIPARIVSELGNGSTDAGAKQLYAMMARIQAGRKKTMGKNNVAVDSKAVKHLPA